MSTLFAAVLLSDAKESSEVSVYSKGPFIRLRKGIQVYPIGLAVFHSFPSEFEGHKVTSRKVGASDPVEFEVKNAGIVRLVVAGKPLTELASKGWVEVGKVTIVNPDGHVFPYPILILEKRLEVGEYSMPSEGNFGVRLLKK